MSLNFLNKCLLYYCIICCFQNLKCLRFEPRDTIDSALEKFCAAMPHITTLKMSCEYYENNYDGVLRAVAANMPHLKCLDISYCKVDPKSIEYLLPTEDNSLGGCPELVELDLRYIKNVDEKLLKKIVLALPKLTCLQHELLIIALGQLIDNEMGVDTARSMNTLYSMHFYAYFLSYSPLEYDILVKSPVFQRINKNITSIDLDVPEQKSALLCNVLMLLPNLERIILKDISDPDEHLLPVLESIGDRLQQLRLCDISGNLSVHDIIRTCRNLVLLILSRDVLRYDNYIDHDLKEMSIVPDYLREIQFTNVDAGMCRAGMLTALLQAPNLDKVHLNNVEVMFDDVMLNALSARNWSGLSKVSKIVVQHCPLIGAAPFEYWLEMENFSLQYMSFFGCEKIDYKILVAAAKKCDRALLIEERSSGSLP